MPVSSRIRAAPRLRSSSAASARPRLSKKRMPGRRARPARSIGTTASPKEETLIAWTPRPTPGVATAWATTARTAAQTSSASSSAQPSAGWAKAYSR